MTEVWLAGVFITEKGMASGHIPFLSKPISVLAESYKMTENEIWALIADDLEELARTIRKMMVEEVEHEP